MKTTMKINILAVLAMLAVAQVQSFASPCDGKAVKGNKAAITQAEAQAMLSEADDFIDGLPDGVQDRQAAAVSHATGGTLTELNAVRKQRNATVQLASGVKTTGIAASRETGGIPLRLYLPEKPAKGKLPLLVYLHGGGWCFGSVNSCAAFCSALASKGVAVLAADYSLSPENPWPKALDECVTAFEYAVKHASEWGADPKAVSLGGDSAGGNLALACALRGAHEAKPRSLVLFYPVVKAWAEKTGSWKKWNKGYGLDSRLMEAFIDAYVAKADPRNPEVSPACSADAQLSALPPVLMIGGDRDILHDQNEEFASRLVKNGVAVTRAVFPGAVHLFITVDGQPSARNKAVELAAAFLH